MIAYYITCQSSDEFANNLLKGSYDHRIYSYLYDLAKEKGYQRFKAINPTEYFEFNIELADDGEFLYITPWNLNSYNKWDPNVSELERKAMMLLAAIIRDKHEQITRVLSIIESQA